MSACSAPLAVLSTSVSVPVPVTVLAPKTKGVASPLLTSRVCGTEALSTCAEALTVVTVVWPLIAWPVWAAPDHNAALSLRVAPLPL